MRNGINRSIPVGLIKSTKCMNVHNSVLKVNLLKGTKINTLTCS